MARTGDEAAPVVALRRVVDTWREAQAWGLIIAVALPAVISHGETISERASRIAARMTADRSVHVIDDGPQGVTLDVATPPGKLAGTLMMTTDAPPDVSPRVITPSFYWFMHIRDFDSESIDHLTEVA